MIDTLKRVTGMELIPHACVMCSNNPVDEVTGQQQDAIFAPGVDVNWGDSVYICKSCVEIMSDLFDRVSFEEHRKLKEEYEDLKEEHEDLLEVSEKDKEVLARIRDGKQALTEVKKRKAA
jgi:hypothetical protein